MRLYSTLPRLFARIRKADADSTISQPRYGRNQPPLNHEPTTLRVESKNDSDSTIPHPHIHYSPTTNHKRLKFWYNISAFSEEDVGLKNRAGGPSEMMLI